MKTEIYETIYNIGYGDALFALSTTPPNFFNAEQEGDWYDIIESKLPNIFNDFFKLKVKTGEIKSSILSKAKFSKKDFETSEHYAALAEKLSTEFQALADDLKKTF